MTPQHPNSFNKNGANATTSAPQQATSAPAPQPVVQQPPQPDPSQQPFSDLNALTDVCSRTQLVLSEIHQAKLDQQTPAINFDFPGLESSDLLENFDFDTFLNTDADTAGFGFDPNISYATDGVETGAGDSL